MKALPDGFGVDQLEPALVDGWGLAPRSIVYAPLGFGSYHWSVSCGDGTDYFVTVDDLDHKPWLGVSREETFAGLRTAYSTAMALQRECGLDFVVAPIACRFGDAVLRVGSRHALAVFPMVDGEAGHFGDDPDPSELAELVTVVGELHGADPRTSVPRVDVPLAGRTGVEVALRELGRPWPGGPYSEPARGWLSDHQAAVRGELDRLDQLVEATHGLRCVITHGEPHPGNVLRADGRLRLIDWDTVALAPPERDLWLLGGGEALQQYASATGHVPDEGALALYRLAWDLADVAAYVALFRSPHEGTEDTDAAWTYLLTSTSIGDAS